MTSSNNEDIKLGVMVVKLKVAIMTWVTVTDVCVTNEITNDMFRLSQSNGIISSSPAFDNQLYDWCHYCDWKC